METLLWGIDVGGTKLEGVVCKPDDPLNPLARIRIPTEARKGYQQVLDNIKELVRQLEEKSGAKPEAIGFGTPGALDPSTGLLKNSNTACLRDKPLLSDLKELFKLEVRMANDANCFTLAEANYGAAKGADIVFGVIIGTGVGGGLVVHGRTIAGLQGIAGEWGHNVLDTDGPDCYCGKRGCVETLLSGPGLERYYRKLTGVSRSLSEIVTRASGGETAAGGVLSSMALWFGRGISTVINIIDPEVIVVGGGVSNIDLLYNEGIARAEEYVFNNQLQTRIVKNELGDSAGVFGAALLVRDLEA